jgi:prepilin-type N-terminal cleavage/methylation domain-containing protein
VIDRRRFLRAAAAGTLAAAGLPIPALAESPRRGGTLNPLSRFVDIVFRYCSCDSADAMLIHRLRLAVSPRAKAHWAESGFTLVEIIITAAVIGLGLVGVVAGFLYAVGGIEAGRQQTTAAFLAEQRMEQLKAGALNNFLNVTTASYPAEGYGSISNNGHAMPGYRRTVTIVDTPAGLADTKLVEVTVFYRPVVGFGVLATEREVRLSALLTSRR